MSGIRIKFFSKEVLKENKHYIIIITVLGVGRMKGFDLEKTFEEMREVYHPLLLVV